VEREREEGVMGVKARNGWGEEYKEGKRGGGEKGGGEIRGTVKGDGKGEELGQSNATEGILEIFLIIRKQMRIKTMGGGSNGRKAQLAAMGGFCLNVDNTGRKA